MNSYQKTAILVFRIFAVLMIFVGVVSTFLRTYPASPSTTIIDVILLLFLVAAISSLPGIILLLLSAKIGMLIGRDLKD